MLCSKLSNVRLVRLLLENKARLNAVDMVGATALMISSEQGNLQVVNVLVKAGADLEVEAVFGGGEIRSLPCGGAGTFGSRWAFDESGLESL